MANETSKKVFVSYARTDESHKDRVVKIASSLISDHGIDIILDLWNCPIGTDLNVFMESIVNENKVDYVIILSDLNYMNKANDRKGGVGKESVIISSEIYDQLEDSKYIPVFLDMKEEKPTLPTFCSTRNAVDMTDIEQDYEKIEEIARRIHDKPLLKKPALGLVPDYDNEASKLHNVTMKFIESKVYNIEKNFDDFFHTIEADLNSLNDAKEYNDKSLVALKPILVNWTKGVRYIINSDYDSISKFINFYNKLLSHLHSGQSSPFTRLFIYFSFLNLVNSLIEFNKTVLLKELLYAKYTRFNRSVNFGVLSSYPFAFSYIKTYQNIEMKRYTLNLLYEGLEKRNLEDIDVILNTIYIINPHFEEEYPIWEGELLRDDFIIHSEDDARIIINKFRNKEFLSRYRFLFQLNDDEIKQKLSELKVEFRNHPNIGHFLKENEIAKF